MTNCAFHFFFSAAIWQQKKKNNSKRGQLFGPLSIPAINQRSCAAVAMSFVLDCGVRSADEASPCRRHLVSGTAPHERQMIGLYPPCSLSLTHSLSISLSISLSLSFARSLARSLARSFVRSLVRLLAAAGTSTPHKAPQPATRCAVLRAA